MEQVSYLPPQILFLEPKADIKGWANLPQEAITKIRALLPEWAFYQPLDVFRSGLPPLDTDIASMAWLRPIMAEYPDDTLLFQEPVPASGGPRTIPGSDLEDFMAGHGYS